MRASGSCGTGVLTQTGGTFIAVGLNVGTGVSNILANGTYALSGGSLTAGA